MKERGRTSDKAEGGVGWDEGKREDGEREAHIGGDPEKDIEDDWSRSHMKTKKKGAGKDG